MVLTIVFTNSTIANPECDYLYADILSRSIVTTVVALFALHTACHVFHVHMSDSCSNQIRIQLFTVGFCSVDETSQHLVGMREFTDAPPWTPPMTSLEAAEAVVPQSLPTGEQLQGI
eukprot:TRINITY_DN10417_c0_g4_i1.p1 TRINITY_DN10417_c0_g4~~TRINITY_DN10417_c0_g4_i1.p1  ORF type:complete len:117 (-),score=18.35 TRINITY_DN10417_c0_g4_i1:295-645(-)